MHCVSSNYKYGVPAWELIMKPVHCALLLQCTWLCTTITALLHYSFLCVFCWMLAEGILLYLLVVRVFRRAAQKWYYLLIFGWGKCTVHSVVLSHSCELVCLTQKRATIGIKHCMCLGGGDRNTTRLVILGSIDVISQSRQ